MSNNAYVIILLFFLVFSLRPWSQISYFSLWESVSLGYCSSCKLSRWSRVWSWEDVLRVQHWSVGDGGPPLWWPALIDVMNVIRCYRRDRSAWPLSLSLPGFLGPTEWANNASEWCAGRGTDGPEDIEESQRDQFSVSVVVIWAFKPLSLWENSAFMLKSPDWSAL